MAVTVATPVPPFATGNVPVTLVVKLTPPVLMLTAPVVTSKFVLLKLATPFTPVVASAAAIVTVAPAPVVEIAPVPVIVNALEDGVTVPEPVLTD